MDFLGGILNFLGGAASEIEAVISYLFSLVVQVFQFIWSTLVAFSAFVLTAFRGIGSFFSHLWDGFFTNIFSRVFNALRNFGAWLATHLAALYDWLQRAQRYILHLYNLYVRPILVMIQRIRQVLTILRALHIKWAQDLDNILAHVQSDINAVFLKINGTINAMIDVLNIITDPARLLRHPTLILSVRRSFLALIRQLTGLPPGFWLPASRNNSAQGVAPLPHNFNLLDPLQNPPASYYMGLDSPVPALDLFPTGETVPDDYGDDVQSFDFIGNGEPRITDCEDGLVCYLQAINDARSRA